MTHRTLVLLRHAKSDWPDGVPDHERPLASRGRRDAPAMGRWLRAEGCGPDHVVCSTAVRTRQTWELVRSELDGHPKTVFEARAYAASTRELADLVTDTPAAAKTLLLISHNPGIEDLALTLAADATSAKHGQTDDLDRMRAKFPTAAIAVFEWSGGWDRHSLRTARLTRFVTPRDL